MPVADFAWRAFADRAAARLQAEGFAAAVWEPEQVRERFPAHPTPCGPTVVVRQRDHDEVAVLLRLFAEVDEGRSAVAPPPRSLWAGPAYRVALALMFLAVVVFTVVMLVAAAFPS